MKLSELKAELEKRSLPTVGTKMTLELRLRNAMQTAREPPKQKHPSRQDYLRPMGSAFSFGQPVEQVEPVIVSRAIKAESPPQPPPSSLGNDDYEMGSNEPVESTMYPPKADFLPLPDTDSKPARGIHSRLSGRLGQGVISDTGRSGRVSVFQRLRDDRCSDEGSTSGSAAGDTEVFNEQRKLARAQRFRTDSSGSQSNSGRGWYKSLQGSSSDRFGSSKTAMAPPLVEMYQEYDIDKMEGRAEKFSDVYTLKRRARRFDEETADELVQPKQAQRKNDRFKRFKLGDADTSSSSSEEDEDQELDKLLAVE